MADDPEFDDCEKPEDLFGNPFGDEDSSAADEDSLGEKEVSVVGVFEQQDQTGAEPSAYVVLLRDSAGRSVPIWIGRFEAMAISLALEGADTGRPLPYDMFNNLITKMGARVERILIDDLWKNTYYAKISVSYDGKSFDADSRPSDAIAMGLRAKAPIYISEAVLRRAAVTEE